MDGWGESLTLLMPRISVAGILVVIVLLLVFMANQMTRIKQALKRFAAINAHRMDEMLQHVV